MVFGKDQDAKEGGRGGAKKLQLSAKNSASSKRGVAEKRRRGEEGGEDV